jgi:predicted DNA-binding transcriptional regulator YafY
VEYKDSKGNSSERDFEPHALVFFDGVWYSKGFCRTRNEMRTLVLPRIQNIIVTPEEFEPDPAIIKTANEEGIFDPEMVEDVVVQCDEYLANIIQTRPLHPEQIIVVNDTGCKVRVKKMSKYRLITWVMHQCGRAKVISPAILRDDVVVYADKMLKKHKMENKDG